MNCLFCEHMNNYICQLDSEIKDIGKEIFGCELHAEYREKQQKIVENAPTLNIFLKDGSILRNVKLFTEKTLSESIVKTEEEAIDLLEYQQKHRIIFFSGKYVQGGISSSAMIECYSIFQTRECE